MQFKSSIYDELISNNVNSTKINNRQKVYRNNDLTVEECCKVLDISKREMLELINNNSLKAYESDLYGYLIEPKELRNFIKSSVEEKAAKNCELRYKNKASSSTIFSEIESVSLIKVKGHNDEYVNSIYSGDNIHILKKLIDRFKGKIDLIYIDPPYGTKQDFITYDGIKAYSDKITDSDFLEFLRKRLYFMKELLSDKGSIYVHIDKKMGHYVKIIMDEIFGEENYLNEISRIKCNPKNFSRKAYGNIIDSIYFYAKNKDKNIWNNITIPLEEEDIKRLFPKVMDNGERYTTNPLHAPGETKNGPTGGEWKGMYPPEGRHWRYSPDVLTELDNKGLIEWSTKGNPRKIVFAKDHEGKKIQDLWEYKDKGNNNSNYPTEKNNDMLNMIIRNSSNEDSIVLDAFMGSGSTIIQAAKLNRKFIGIDVSEHSIKVAQELLNDNNINYNLYEISKENKSVE